MRTIPLKTIRPMLSGAMLAGLALGAGCTTAPSVSLDPLSGDAFSSTDATEGGTTSDAGTPGPSGSGGGVEAGATTLDGGGAFGGDPADGGADGGEPDATGTRALATGTVLCSVLWEQATTVYPAVSAVAAAPDGGTFLAVLWNNDPRGDGSFADTFAAGSVRATVPQGMAILSLDASCHLRWMHSFGGTLEVYGLGRTADGGVTASGYIERWAELDAPRVSYGDGFSGSGGIFILHLDPSGTTSWSFTSPVAEGIPNPVSIAIGPDDEATVLVPYGASTHLRAGTLVADGGAQRLGDSILQVDAQGSIVSETAATAVSNIPSMTMVLGLARGSGADGDRVFTLGASDPQAEGGANRARWSLLSFPAHAPDAGPLAAKVVPLPIGNDSVGILAGGSNGVLYAQRGAEVLALTGDGTVNWTSEPPLTSAFYRLLAVDRGAARDARDRIFIAGTSRGVPTVPPTANDLGSGTLVEAIDSSGHHVAQLPWRDRDDDVQVLGTDDVGHVVFAGVSAVNTVGSFANPRRLFFVKARL